MNRKFADAEKVVWVKRAPEVVTVIGARLDFPMTSIKWDGTLKPGAAKEWHYTVAGVNREIREKNLARIVSLLTVPNKSV